MVTETLKRLTDLLNKQGGLTETANLYKVPLPRDVKVGEIIINSPAHIGNRRGAIDFLVDIGTCVLAPLDGVVVAKVDKHYKYGPGEEFSDYLNEIVIKHTNGEYSQLAHLAKYSVLVKVGEQVSQGQILAYTGLSGWMTDPHLHFFVFTFVNNQIKGCKIKFRVLKTLYSSS